MCEKLPKYWGHDCEFLSKQLFRVLSDDCRIGRVYFKTFLDRLYQPMFNAADVRTKMHFVFKLLDTDQDGILKAQDLTKCQE